MDGINNSVTVSDHSWTDISAWLEWWLKEPRLTSGNQKVLDRYYLSYKQSFSQYLREHYSSQTDELLCLISSMNRPFVFWRSVVGVALNPCGLP